MNQNETRAAFHASTSYRSSQSAATSSTSTSFGVTAFHPGVDPTLALSAASGVPSFSSAPMGNMAIVSTHIPSLKDSSGTETFPFPRPILAAQPSSGSMSIPSLSAPSIPSLSAPSEEDL